MLTIDSITYLSVDTKGYKDIIKKLEKYYPSFIRSNEAKALFSFLLLPKNCIFTFDVFYQAFNNFKRLSEDEFVLFRDFIIELFEDMVKSVKRVLYVGSHDNVIDLVDVFLNLYSLVFFFKEDEIAKLPYGIIKEFGFPRQFEECVRYFSKVKGGKVFVKKLVIAFDTVMIYNPFAFRDCFDMNFGICYLKSAIKLFEEDNIPLLEMAFRLDKPDYLKIFNDIIISNEHLISNKETLNKLKDFIAKKIIERV